MNILGAVLKFRLRVASPSKRAKLMKKHFYHCGNNVLLFTHKFGTEPYLISIHSNVICAADVRFINHDLSIRNMERTINDGIRLDKVGSIELFRNSFIGAYTTLMPNTSVGENSIVAAGSVVTKHIPPNQVWGGVPAKFIMTVDELAKKMKMTTANYPWMKINNLDKKQLIRLRQEYFFHSGH